MLACVSLCGREYSSHRICSLLIGLLSGAQIARPGAVRAFRKRAGTAGGSGQAQARTGTVAVPDGPTTTSQVS